MSRTPNHLISSPTPDMARTQEPDSDLVHYAGRRLGHVASRLAQVADASGEAGPSPVESHDIHVRFNTFAEAESITKHVGDEFIDRLLTNKLDVGGEWAAAKGYIDRIETTRRDDEVIRDPSRIAGLYRSTTEMVMRNLKLIVKPDMTDARRAQVKQAKNAFVSGLRQEIPRTEAEIIQWCNRGTDTSKRFPMQAHRYMNFMLDGKEMLESGTQAAPDAWPNIKVQRQVTGTFVTGSSDVRLRTRRDGGGAKMERRIYLNPDIEATPHVFEQVLKRANEEGLEIQFKMAQQAPDAATLHAQRRQNPARRGGMRGDGIVIYASREQADEVLAMALDIAKENSEAFVGRGISRIPVRVADGVAVGDEPHQRESLASSRANLLEEVAREVLDAKKQGVEARALFRKLYHIKAAQQGFSTRNIAFNR